MGYSYRGNIKDYWPDDTEDTIYLWGERSFSEISSTISEKFGDVSPNDIYISAEHIHTSCLTHDRYDPYDYTTFTIIKKMKN